MNTRIPRNLTLLTLACVLTACDTTPTLEPDAAGVPEVVETTTFEQAREILRDAALARNTAARELTFEEFEETVYKEPWEGGKYIVNGDSPIADRKHLREFYDKVVDLGAPRRTRRTELPSHDAALIVHQNGALDAIWNDSVKTALTYCVSTTFDERYENVAAMMREAAAAWEAVANIAFIHDATQDSVCTAENPTVVFDVRPAENAGYLARAFFPNDGRAARNVIIDSSSFGLDPERLLTLTGILRHELGHALGFRHEHTRPDSGTCFEDSEWRPLTEYDAFSVMHYPQCNGQGDWSLTLTTEDQNGAACLYGAAEGFTIDPAICEAKNGDSTPGEPQTRVYADQSVDRDQTQLYGPFEVATRTLFEASIGGPNASGDADLYVRFGGEPSTDRYGCRPYLPDSVESCSVDVPPRESTAFVMVRGYRAGTYDLTVSYTPSP